MLLTLWSVRHQRGFYRVVQGEDFGHSANFENLPDQTIQAADPEFTAILFQLLGNRYDRTQAHAADVNELA